MLHLMPTWPDYLCHFDLFTKQKVQNNARSKCHKNYFEISLVTMSVTISCVALVKSVKAEKNM